MAETDSKALGERLSEYFATRADVAFAYLFGSAASDRSTAESDVDVAVYFRDDTGSGAAGTSSPAGAAGHALPDVEESGKRFVTEDEIWTDLERLCGRSVDLVTLNRAAATVGAGAMLTGTLLYSIDESTRNRFFLTVTTLAEEERDFARDFVRIKRRSKSLSEVDRARLVRIVDFLDDELEDAPQFVEMNIELYSTDRDFRRSVERWVENLANASIDAAKIVLASERRPVPQTYRETVELLGTVEGFKHMAEDARYLAENTRVRNMLAHEYLDLRYTVVNNVVDHADKRYGKLVEALRTWIE